jgi:hypothetical protein
MKRLLFGLLVLTACGRDTSTQPTPNLSGNWSGTITSSQSSDGTISLTLTQMGLVLLPPGVGSEQVITGTWMTSFRSVGPTSNDGTVSGQVDESSVAFSLTPSQPIPSGICPRNFTGALTNATSIHGTYVTFNCTFADSGTFTVTKQ